MIQGFRHAIESGTEHHEMEYRILRPDGELRWIFGRGRVVRDARGEAVRYSGVDIDITERKRMQSTRGCWLPSSATGSRTRWPPSRASPKQSLADGRRLDDARAAFTRRLHALANTHSLLTESEWRGAKLSAFIEDELRPYGEHASFEGRDLVLTPRAAC